MLDDLKHGNTYYTGVETDKGVLLFSEDIRGEMQYSDYMYKYIENDFFDPEFTVKSLAVHKLRGWPSLMENKVNRYGEPGKYGSYVAAGVSRQVSAEKCNRE